MTAANALVYAASLCGSAMPPVWTAWGFPGAAVLHGKSCVRRAPCTWKKRQKNRLTGFRRAVFGFCNFRNFAAKRLPCGRDGGFPSHIRPRTARQRMRCRQYATTDPFRRRDPAAIPMRGRLILGGFSVLEDSVRGREIDRSSLLCDLRRRGLHLPQGEQTQSGEEADGENPVPAVFLPRAASRRFRSARQRGGKLRRMLVLSATLPGALSPARYCPLRRAPPAACPARIRAPRPAQPGLRP